jgi:heme/copper-type cytochrome/quinol oxidase subunit 2
MSPLRIVATAGLAAAMSSLTIGSASAAAPGPVAQPAGVHTQLVSITIRSGDRIVEPNFALAPGVPVQIRVTNFTHEFHTFTIPGLKVNALILPSVGQTPKTTVVAFTPQFAGPFTWRCVICPSGAHGQRHAMDGTVYMILDPSTLP